MVFNGGVNDLLFIGFTSKVVSCQILVEIVFIHYPNTNNSCEPIALVYCQYPIESCNLPRIPFPNFKKKIF